MGRVPHRLQQGIAKGHRCSVSCITFPKNPKRIPDGDWYARVGREMGGMVCIGLGGGMKDQFRAYLSPNDLGAEGSGDRYTRRICRVRYMCFVEGGCWGKHGSGVYQSPSVIIRGAGACECGGGSVTPGRGLGERGECYCHDSRRRGQSGDRYTRSGYPLKMLAFIEAGSGRVLEAVCTSHQRLTNSVWDGGRRTPGCRERYGWCVVRGHGTRWH